MSHDNRLRCLNKATHNTVGGWLRTERMILIDTAFNSGSKVAASALTITSVTQTAGGSEGTRELYSVLPKA